jgi:hypothetical protein
MAEYGNCIAFEKLTVTNAVKQLTAAKYNDVGVDKRDASVAFISLAGVPGTNDLRWTLDGTAPVAATTGHVLQAGGNLTVKGRTNIANLKLIRDGSSDGLITISYFGV